MKTWAVALMSLTVACSGSAFGNSPPFPPKGMYALVSSRPSGAEKHSEQFLDLGGRQQFEAFIAKMLNSNCKRTVFEVKDGTFAIEGTCDTPEGDFRGLPVKFTGTWTENSIDVDNEITLMGAAIRTHRKYTFLYAADNAHSGRNSGNRPAAQR
ncbi:hypothetical protein NSE01_07520 [Novosphingobium sediminis]|uniref:DUF3617 domain-containing protein n=1 Tax=Novosphingobium sediminis TaxID=707214 RepID=A0A512AGU6_9SPHN|nr:hypothetical protein [Novosphingobium sediminis]GEN98919.1 hypothetical protein NSE01_07520 [Novosphingobium sediminis]